MFFFFFTTLYLGICLLWYSYFSVYLAFYVHPAKIYLYFERLFIFFLLRYSFQFFLKFCFEKSKICKQYQVLFRSVISVFHNLSNLSDHLHPFSEEIYLCCLNMAFLTYLPSFSACHIEGTAVIGRTLS